MHAIFHDIDGETVKLVMLAYIGGAVGVVLSIAGAVAVPGVI